MKTKLRKQTVNRLNPFLDNLFEKNNVKQKKYKAGPADQVLVNKNTGEVEGHMAAMIHRKVDEEKFIKVFVDKFSLFFGLSKRAQAIMSFIVKNLRPNDDQITIQPEYDNEEIGYKSKAPIFSGISELIDQGFIARTTLKHRYFINPNIFFNGNRISFIESYEKQMTQEGYREGKDIQNQVNNDKGISDNSESEQ